MIFDGNRQFKLKNRPFDICLNQGKLVGRIRAVGGCVILGETVNNTLKRGGTEKRGGKTKNLKRRHARSGGGCLKNGASNYSNKPCISM